MVKVINFIRSRAKNHRFFQLLATEMGAQHVGLLFYTKVRRLSRNKCLSRLYERSSFLNPILSALTQVPRFTSCPSIVCKHHHATLLCQWHPPFPVQSELNNPNLYELKNEVEIFLRKNKNNLHVKFHNEEFVAMFAYLADVFGHLNNMNLCSSLVVM